MTFPASHIWEVFGGGARRWSKVASLTTVFALVVSVAGGSVDVPRSADEVIALIEKAENALTDARVQFTQVTTLKAMAESQEMRGELRILKSPERFEARFRFPTEQVVHYDGSRLLIYFPDTKQAFRQPAKPGDLSAFLGVNPASLSETFRNGWTARLLGCDGATCQISFTRSATPGREWRVRVEMGRWLLKEASYETKEVRVVLKCDNYKINEGVDEASFKMSLPDDVVVHDGIPQFMGAGAMP